jgi:hypothetical protein
LKLLYMVGMMGIIKGKIAILSIAPMPIC